MTVSVNRLWLAAALAAVISGPVAPAWAQEAPPPPRPAQGPDAQSPDAQAPDDTAPDGTTPDGTAADEGSTPQPSAPLTFGLAGPYLAARIATFENDFQAAGYYFGQAVEKDPGDPFLLDSALVAMISAGQMDQTEALIGTMATRGVETELSGLVIRADLARTEKWDELIALIEKTTEADATPPSLMLLDGMLLAWAKLGAGRASEAMADFEELRQVEGADGMVNYQLAMARALAGDFEGANQLLAEGNENNHLLALLARAQILAQLDRRDEALEVLSTTPGAENEPMIQLLRQQLENGNDIGFDIVSSPRDGIAQVFLTFASILAGSPEPEPLALIHARLASWLAPELGDARLMTAQLLQLHGQYDLAEIEFEALRSLGQVRPVAELTRIDALARAGRHDEAEKAALALTAAYPELAQVWIAQGDLLRQRDKFSAAVPAYDKALSLIPEDEPEARWFPLYARGIALERSGQFDRAEADLQAALAIRPDQPSLLNYLGYSWIDRNQNLDEALALIEKAVELAPEDAYIQDSLAWAYFRLGRYQEAVAPMELAARSMSADPLINDHLGDIYWMVGRHREAEIQWRRALSLDPTETEDDVNPDRIRAKLERGLDAVTAEEDGGAVHRPTPQSAPQPDQDAEGAGDGDQEAPASE